MRSLFLQSALLISWLIVGSSLVVANDMATLSLESPIAVRASLANETLCVAMADGKLVLVDAAQGKLTAPKVIVADVRNPPGSLAKVTSMMFRNSVVFAVGERAGKVSLAAFKTEFTGQQTERFIEKQSVELGFAAPGQVNVSLATSAALYFVVPNGTTEAIWRIKPNVATLEEPQRIYEGPGKILSLAINAKGHLLSVVQRDDQLSLRFHQQTEGTALLSLPLQLDTVSEMVSGPDELLYVLGSIAGKKGVYRIDAAYRESRQVTSAVLVQQDDNLIGLAASKTSLALLTPDSVSLYPLVTPAD